MVGFGVGLCRGEWAEASSSSGCVVFAEDEEESIGGRSDGCVGAAGTVVGVRAECWATGLRAGRMAVVAVLRETGA